MKALIPLLILVGTTGLTRGQAPAESRVVVADAHEKPAVSGQSLAKLETARNIIQKHCVECHGPKKQKGRFRIDDFALADLLDVQVNHLFEAIDKVRLHEMPPKEDAKISTNERQALLSALEASLQLYKDRMIDTAMGGRRLPVRLTKKQFIQSTEKLLGVTMPMKAKSFLLEDAISEQGFDNNEVNLVMSPLNFEYYYHALEACLDEAIITPEEEMPPFTGIEIELYRNPEAEGLAVSRRLADKSSDRCLAFSAKAIPPSPQTINGTQYLCNLKHVQYRKEDLQADDPRGKKAIRKNLPALSIGVGFKDWSRYDVTELGYVLQPVWWKEEYGGNRQRACSPNLKVGLRKAIHPAGLYKISITACKGDDSPEHPLMQVLMGETGPIEYYASSILESPIVVDAPKGKFEVYEQWVDMASVSNIKEPRLHRRKPLGPGVVIYNETGNHSAETIEGTATKSSDWGDTVTKTPALVVKRIKIEGPYFEGWPHRAHRKIFPDDVTFKSKSESDRAKSIIGNFSKKIATHGIPEEKQEAYHDLWKALRPKADSFETSIKDTLLAMASSHHYLYFRDPPDDRNNKAVRLSKIIKFLWNRKAGAEEVQSIIDWDLPEEQAIERILDSPEFNSFIETYYSQWLDLTKGSKKGVEGRYSRHVKPYVLQEPYAFISYLYQKNLSMMNLIHSDFLLLNVPLATYYGIPGVKSTGKLVKVDLPPDSHRGGVLTMALPMIAQADDNGQSHPIRRGAWIVERILGRQLPPPPKTVNFPDPDSIPGFHSLSIKEQLKIHMTDASCAGCHKRIDPFGIPLENFDGYGQWRVQVIEKNAMAIKEVYQRGLADSSTTIKGVPIANAMDLKKYLLGKEEELGKSMIRHMLTYAMGREITRAHDDLVQDVYLPFKESGFKSRKLIHLIVKSPLF
jgi:mono/diheme cytochrome c family protein